MDDSTLNFNTEQIKGQLDLLMKNGQIQATRHQDTSDAPDFEIVDNFEWQSKLSLLGFLDSVGTKMRISSMLGRESVQKRLASDSGMSFTEFTYQLLQGYDFYHLYQTRNCRLQIGGSDQWGNILSGVEMIGKLLPDAKVSALTFPLLTTFAGEKMGKSAGNAIWLNPKMTSSFDFYQYFMRIPDGDAAKLLSMMTFLPDEQIKVLQQENPESRLVQSTLAKEVTAFVHGQSALQDAIRVSSLLFDEYDHVFKNQNDQRLLANVLRQSQRHLLISLQDISVLSILGVLRRLMPESSNSTPSSCCYLCRLIEGFGHIGRSVY